MLVAVRLCGSSFWVIFKVCAIFFSGYLCQVCARVTF